MPGCPEHHASARLSHQYSRLQRRHEISRSPHTCRQYIDYQTLSFSKVSKVNSMSKTVWRCWTQRKARVRHSSIFAGSTKNIPHSFPTCFVHLYHVQTPIKHHRGAQFLTLCLSFVSSFKTKPPKTSLQIHYFGWKDH